MSNLVTLEYLTLNGLGLDLFFLCLGLVCVLTSLSKYFSHMLLGQEKWVLV